MGRSKGLVGIKVYPLRMPQSLFGGGEFSGLHLGEGRGLCSAALVETLCLSLAPRMGDAGTCTGENALAHAKLSRTINPKLFEVSLPRYIGGKNELLDVPGGPVVKNPSAKAGDTGFILGPGKIPHASGQLSPSTTTTEAHAP